VVSLRGVSWAHPRGHTPLVAAAERYAGERPGVSVVWETRSLQAFGDQPIAELAERYDLLVIDHPHVGEVAGMAHLAPLDELLPAEALARLEQESAGPSHRSYFYGGHQWALAIDAAAHVAARRPDRVRVAPHTWAEVHDLAADQVVLWPLKPVDAICSFFSLVAGAALCPVSTQRLVDEAVGVRALSLMRSIGELIPDRCLEMSPIDVLDELAEGSEAVYSPLLFGYSNYARPGFRPHVVRFTAPPSSWSGGPAGSILGGAGIAVSSHSAHSDEAARHALWLASADLQRTTYGLNDGQPGNRVAWHDAALNAASSNYFADTWDVIDSAWVRPRQPRFVQFQTQAGDLVHRFLQGSDRPEQVVTELNDLYERTAS
jgi:multiple sugar transport system substrate-binding protein